jgi:hypothetical protein
MPQRWDAGGRGVRQEDEGGQRPTIEIPLEAHRDRLERKVKQHRNCCSRRPLLRSYRWLQSPFWSVASTFIICAVVFHTADATKLELTDCFLHDGKLTCLRSTSARTRFYGQITSGRKLVYRMTTPWRSGATHVLMGCSSGPGKRVARLRPRATGGGRVFSQGSQS